MTDTEKKSKYPRKVTFDKDKNGKLCLDPPILVEDGIRYETGSRHLEIAVEVTNLQSVKVMHKENITDDKGEKIEGKSQMRDQSNISGEGDISKRSGKRMPGDKLSFFGSETATPKIDVVIRRLNTYTVAGYEHYKEECFHIGGMKEYDSDWQEEKDEENFFLELFLKDEQFYQIQEGVIDDSISALIISFEIKNISGLFINDQTFTPPDFYRNYKLLNEIQDIENPTDDDDFFSNLPKDVEKQLRCGWKNDVAEFSIAMMSPKD
ncbi:uncharacterized protein METZ01_LOCUS396564, partial [marine metagenome]